MKKTKKVHIIFNDQHKTKESYDIVAWEIHTYGFLELVYENDTREFVNLANIFSFKG